MILKLILLAGAAYFAFRAIAQWQAQLRGPPRPPDPRDSRDSRDSREPEQKPFELMQRCRGCGAYLPVDSLSRSGRCGRCSD